MPKRRRPSYDWTNSPDPEKLDANAFYAWKVEQRIPWKEIGRAVHDPNARQLQCWIHGQQRLPMALAIRASEYSGVPLWEFLDEEQRGWVRYIKRTRIPRDVLDAA